MAKTKEQVAADPAEDYLLPHERAGSSVDDAAQSLFEVMDSEDDDFGPEDPTPKNEPTSGDDPEESEEDEYDEDLEDVEDDDEEDFDDEDLEDDRDEGGDEDDDDVESLTDETVISGVPLPGGEETEVTLAELKAGYSRTADYTRKRQRDAAEHAQTMESLREVRERYDANLAKLQETLEEMGPQKPDAKLKASNPGAYAAQLLEWREHQDNLKAVGAERGAVDEDRQRDVQGITQEVVQQEWQKLLQAVPEWTDEEKASTDLAALGQFAKDTYGWTQEQLNNVVDHRLILMLRENMQARQTTERGKKRVAQKKRRSRKLTPGSRRTKRGGRSNTDAGRLREQLAQRGGGLRDHARLFEMEEGDDL